MASSLRSTRALTSNQSGTRRDRLAEAMSRAENGPSGRASPSSRSSPARRSFAGRESERLVALHLDHNRCEVLVPDALAHLIEGLLREGPIIVADKDDGWDSFNVEDSLGAYNAVGFEECSDFQSVRVSLGNRVATNVQNGGLEQRSRAFQASSASQGMSQRRPSKDCHASTEHNTNKQR